MWLCYTHTTFTQKHIDWKKIHIFFNVFPILTDLSFLTSMYYNLLTCDFAFGPTPMLQTLSGVNGHMKWGIYNVFITKILKLV